MAYGTKYRSEFKDRLGLLWRVDIEEDAYGGAVTNLKPTGEPLTFDFLSNSDNIFEEPIHGSTVQIGIYSETDFAWTSLYNYGSLVYRVSIYYGDSYTLYWRGFINSEGYEEPYDGVAYPVVLSASDGLGQLKTMLYKYQTTDPDDTYYDGRKTESQIIYDILAKINITGFTEYINLYDIGMSDAVTDSPLDQVRIDVDVFKDMYCYEVLTHILVKYNACIRQVGGAMVIYRPAEIGDATVYGRTFTSATSHSGTSYTPAQFIDRKTNVTDFRATDGGSMLIMPPIKKLKVMQDYGYKESWLEGYKFKAEDYDDSTYLFEHWSRVGTAGLQRPVAFALIKDENEGVVFAANNKTFAELPDTANYIYQDFGPLAIPSSDAYAIEFEYRIINLGATDAPLGLMYVEVKNTLNNNWLYEYSDTLCKWKITQGYIELGFVDVPRGEGEWTTYSRAIDGLPTNGPYRISFFAMNEDMWLAIKNVRIYGTADKITKKKKKKKRGIQVASHKIKRINLYTIKDEEEVVDYDFEVTNDIAGLEVEQDYILGDVPNASTPASDRDTDIDNVIEQFQGSLSLYGIMSIEEAAAAFVADHANDYSPGDVTVTQGTAPNDEKIIFTATYPGLDFTGSTSVANTSGNLSGTVTNTQASSPMTPEIDTITLAGSSGTATVSCNGYSATITYNVAGLEETASAFVDSQAGNFLDYDVILTYDTGGKLVFTSRTGQLIPDAAISNLTGNLTGTKANTQEYIAGTARIDTVTLSGTSGTANITCDGVTKEVAIIETNELTTKWHKGPTGTEDLPLLELITDERKKQHSLPQQFLSLPFIEKGVNSINPVIKVVGNFQDPLNIEGSYNKIFAVNGAFFDVKNRSWEIDMNEIKMFRQPAIVFTIYYGQTAEISAYSGSIAINETTLNYSFTLTNVASGECGCHVYKNGDRRVDLDFSREFTTDIPIIGTLTVEAGQYNDYYEIFVYEL